MLNFLRADRTSGSRTSIMEDVITRLYKVPGMTNDEMCLYVDKAPVYIRFKDGSGTLCLFFNFLKIPHVYVFDKKNRCRFAGYVGWIHRNGLINEVDSLKTFLE